MWVSQNQFDKEVQTLVREFLDKDTTSIVLQYAKDAILNLDILNAASILYFGHRNRSYDAKRTNDFWKHRNGELQPVIQTNRLDSLAAHVPFVLLEHLTFLKKVCFINTTAISFQFILETSSSSSTGENKTKIMTIDWKAASEDSQFFSVYDFLSGTIKSESHMSPVITSNTFSLAGYKVKKDGSYMTIIQLGDLETVF